MVFNQTAIYALRAMSTLAAHDGKGYQRSRSLSEWSGVPTSYLQKIMCRLGKAKLVKAQKGHNGGFRLSRPPHDITLFEVLEAIDHDLVAFPCVFGKHECDTDNPCLMHDTWMELRECFWNWGQTHTLADTVERPSLLTPPVPMQQTHL